MHDDPATGHDHDPEGVGVQAVAPPPDADRPSDAIDARSPNASVCPFLRSIGEGDVLARPVEAPDVANRCAALADAVPQSMRQQELVCLTSGHVNCPRYRRGAVAVAEPVTNTVVTARPVTPATAGALIAFGIAFVVSVGFVLANGGLTLVGTSASASPTNGGIAVVPTASPTTTPTPTPTPSPTPSPTESPSPSPAPTPSPSPSPSASATPKPSPKPTSRPTSDRYKLLKPCPNKPNCYLYVVRSGDNLYSIANYFGVPLKTVRSLNPWVKNGLQVGRSLQLPPPTR